MKAVVMCGGIGSRMRPITEELPKPLLAIGEKRILDLILETLKKNNVDTVFLTLGYMAEEIERHVLARDYGMEIRLVYETKPLGTAGGVKNAVGDCGEDILVVSGDNLFDYDLQQVYREHLDKNALVTIVGTKCIDPRDYGTCVLDKNGRVLRFVEKPNWSQAESDIINTGIYFLSPAVLKKIPDAVFYDFANDLFSQLLSIENGIYCSLARGKWWDLGDIRAYLTAFSELMTDRIFPLGESVYLTQDYYLANGTKIVAPCILGDKVKIGSDCVIGPCVYVAAGSEIDDGCQIRHSILMQDVILGRECRIEKSYIGMQTRLGAFCESKSYAAVGGNAVVGACVCLQENAKIYPGCTIGSHQSVHGDVRAEHFEETLLTASGIAGRPFTGLSLQHAVETAFAVAGVCGVKRIGLSCDGQAVSDIYKNAVRSGLLACGGTVYDFGNIFRVQRKFLSFYCSLDFFIHIAAEEESVRMSFSGKNGQPVSAAVFRQLSASLRYENFSFSPTLKGIKWFEMYPMLTVYKAYLSHLLSVSDHSFKVAVDCDNKDVFEILTNVLKKKKYEIGYGGLLFILDREAERFYAIENERAFSYDRILTICCKTEFEEGKDVSVGEEASGQLEELAVQYGRNIYRAYEDDKELSRQAALLFAENLWVNDALFCIVRLLNIMQAKAKTLSALSDELPDYYMRHLDFSYSGEPILLQTRLSKLGAVRSTGRPGYFEIEDERGLVRLKPDAAGKNLRVLVEAQSMELSRELTAEITEHLSSQIDISNFNNCSIDNLRQR